MPSLDYLALTTPDCGDIFELSNARRTSSYMANGLAPLSYVNVQPCGCDAIGDLLTEVCGAQGAHLTDAGPGAEITGPGSSPLDPGSDLPGGTDGYTIVATTVAAGTTAGSGWSPPSPPTPGAVLMGARISGVETGFTPDGLIAVASLGSVIGGGSLAGRSHLSDVGAAVWTSSDSIATATGVTAGGLVLPADITLLPDHPFDPDDTVLVVGWYNASVGSLAPASPITAATVEWLWSAPDSYTLPDVDDAPWYSASAPESALFAGALITSIDGLDGSPVERSITRLTAGGAALGPLVDVERRITVVAELHGASCCAVAYGMRWLSSVLRRRCNPADCDESDLLFLEGCPDVIDRCGITVDELSSTYWRVATRVGLLEGPVVTARRGETCGSCGCNPSIEVEFTLVAGNPAIFTPTLTVASPITLLYEGESEDECGLTWRCGPSEDCDLAVPIFDPACGFIPPPPTPQPTAACLCDPLAVYRWTFGDLPVDGDSEFTQGVLSVTIGATTDRPLRNLTIRVYRASDAEGSCASRDPYPPCDVIASLGVTYVPAGAVLHVDGVRRRSYLLLPDGRRVNASRFVHAASGSPFQWLELPCGDGYCTTIEADAFNTHAGDWLSTSLALKMG